MFAAFYFTAILISLIVTLRLFLKFRHRSWVKYVSNTCLRGKTFLITDANNNVGREIARALVSRKGRVIVTCRNIEEAKLAVMDIANCTLIPLGGQLTPMELDMSSLVSIENFAIMLKLRFDKIDVIINNANTYVPLKRDEKTKNGFEIHFGANYLGYFHLTNLLLEFLKQGAPSRIVIVSSTLHEKGKINFADLNSKVEIQQAKRGKICLYNSGYNNSMLMNCYFGRSLASLLAGTGVNVSVCCLRFFYTDFIRCRWYHYILMAPVLYLFKGTAKKGAETVVYCATDYAVERVSGNFYRDSKVYVSKYPFDNDEGLKLWIVSQELIKARQPIPDCVEV